MKAKAVGLMSFVLLANLMGFEMVRGDEPIPSTSPAVRVPANSPAPGPDSLPPASKLTWRDKLFHWPAMIHSQPPCKDCGLTDPEFCCMSCRSQWIFLFGSCRAFYGDNRSWR
jgi:hypothetical protein